MTLIYRTNKCLVKSYILNLIIIKLRKLSYVSFETVVPLNVCTVC